MKRKYTNEELLKISNEIRQSGGLIEERLRNKCQWERMTRMSVIKSWGDPRNWKE